MRSRGQSRGSSLLVLIILFCLVLSACPKRPPTGPAKPEIPHKRPPVIRPDETITPERRAADELIEKGTTALEDNDPEKAEGHFQEAIRIAPSYGPAYYWLARAKYELDEMTRAWDLLDRATLLVGHESEWLERIDELRAAISEAGQ